MDRRGKNESFDEWLARKAAKKDKSKQLDGTSRGRLRRTPLKPISKKQQKRNQAYAKAREEHYKDEANQVCFICGRSENLSVHHIRRRGPNTAEKETFVTLCLAGSYLADIHPELNRREGCHNMIEANKGWAREQGFIV